MRFFEFMKAPKLAPVNKPRDPEREEERRTKVQADIDKARSKTLKAAQVYSDRREADDDAERKSQKRLSRPVNG